MSRPWTQSTEDEDVASRSERQWNAQLPLWSAAPPSRGPPHNEGHLPTVVDSVQAERRWNTQRPLWSAQHARPSDTQQYPSSSSWPPPASGGTPEAARYSAGREPDSPKCDRDWPSAQHLAPRQAQPDHSHGQNGAIIAQLLSKAEDLQAQLSLSQDQLKAAVAGNEGLFAINMRLEKDLKRSSDKTKRAEANASETAAQLLRVAKERDGLRKRVEELERRKTEIDAGTQTPRWQGYSESDHTASTGRDPFAASATPEIRPDMFQADLTSPASSTAYARSLADELRDAASSPPSPCPSSPLLLGQHRRAPRRARSDHDESPLTALQKHLAAQTRTLEAAVRQKDAQAQALHDLHVELGEVTAIADQAEVLRRNLAAVQSVAQASHRDADDLERRLCMAQRALAASRKMVVKVLERLREGMPRVKVVCRSGDSGRVSDLRSASEILEGCPEYPNTSTGNAALANEVLTLAYMAAVPEVRRRRACVLVLGRQRWGGGDTVAQVLHAALEGIFDAIETVQHVRPMVTLAEVVVGKGSIDESPWVEVECAAEGHDLISRRVGSRKGTSKDLAGHAVTLFHIDRCTPNAQPSKLYVVDLWHPDDAPDEDARAWIEQELAAVAGRLMAARLESGWVRHDDAIGGDGGEEPRGQSELLRVLSPVLARDGLVTVVATVGDGEGDIRGTDEQDPGDEKTLCFVTQILDSCNSDSGG